MGYRCVLAFSVLSVLTASCGTIDRRVDPDVNDEVGGAVLRSQDIRTMADSMARDIMAFGVLNSSDPDHRTTFHITSLRNDSGDVIDRELILTNLRTELFRAMGGRVRILDRSAEGLEAIRAERQAKREGAVSTNPNRRGELAGSDYVLKGTIKDRSISDGSLKSVYYVVTFELTDLETGELRWTNNYETKFLSEKSVISR